MLKSLRIPEESSREWDRGFSVSWDLTCMFIGKTGYGKSTTLNRIVGREIFQTDDTRACTNRLSCVDYQLDRNGRHFFSLCDLPGIGENRKVDRRYMKWYREMGDKTDCIVYLLRADQRDWTLDLEAMAELNLCHKETLIGLNYCDKVEPLNRTSLTPDPEQQQNIAKKVAVLCKQTGFQSQQVVPYSAESGWNMDILVSQIAKALHRSCGENDKNIESTPEKFPSPYLLANRTWQYSKESSS